METTFEYYLAKEALTFKYARGRSAIDGTELHPYHEILYFMGGKADFLSEHDRLTAMPGMLFIIPKETFHEFRIQCQDTYQRCVLNFPDDPVLQPMLQMLMTRIKVIPNPGSAIVSLLERVIQCLEENLDDFRRQTVLRAAFSLLLVELSLKTAGIVYPRARDDRTLIARALQYIGAHYTGDISVSGIARALHVSKSTLAHCFKKELNIPVYRYITEKRLVYAHKLIVQGIPPTEVCRRCGYSEYSAFYRAYVKMFHKAPRGA